MFGSFRTSNVHIDRDSGIKERHDFMFSVRLDPQMIRRCKFVRRGFHLSRSIDFKGIHDVSSQGGTGTSFSPRLVVYHAV